MAHAAPLNTNAKNIRPPAVAGQFYTANPETLKNDVLTFIKSGKKLPQSPKLLLSPHAGYPFSGPVAGSGYATIDPNITTVFLIGPSHHEWFEGIAVPDDDAWQTPLGEIKLNRKIISALRKSPLVSVRKNADRLEHSLEVQLPFLQVKLSSFTIVPILTGKVDPEAVAALVLPYIDQSTLIIASSDLSHYQPSVQAKKIDQQTLKTMLSGNTGGTLDACGETAIRTMMALAKKLALKPHVLDVRNSFETAPQYGNRDRVVGYASVAYLPESIVVDDAVAIDEADARGSAIPDVIKTWLLQLARETLVAAVNKKPLPSPDNAPQSTMANSGCFVTLTKGGQLRGCIGYIEPIKPLYQAVIENARNAALSDPRFNAVTPQELGNIVIEVSVLTPPELLPYSSPDDLLRKIKTGRDGIILQKDYRQSTFLPQVWEELPDKIDFLQHLSLKGGMPVDGWKTATVKRYRADHFQEE